MIRTPKIFVFLENKIISTDSIVPVCLNIRELHPNIKFCFVFDSYRHFQEISKNKILYNALIELSKKNVVLGGKGSQSSHGIFRRLVIGLQCFVIFLNRLVSVHYYFHFKKLRRYPFKLLNFFSPTKTFHFEPNGWGKPPLMDAVDKSSGNRVAPLPPDRRLQYVGYSDYWLQNKMKSKDTKTIKISNPRLLDPWNLFVQAQMESSDKYSKSACREKREFYVGFLLGYFGKMDIVRSSESMQKCFLESLQTIFEIFPNAHVILKPHFITDLTLLKELIADFSNYQISVDWVHPGLLGKICDLVICNSYSSAMPDVFFQGAVTIEYTDYSEDALRITGGQSVAPLFIDKFINHNDSELRDYLLNESFSRRERDLPSKYGCDDETFYNLFDLS